MNLDKKVLDKIERENIRMIPGWFFVLKTVFLNACWVIAFLGSAVSFAMLLEWSSADTKLATFWSIGFILLSFISFKSAWRINFKALYKYGFAAMIAFLSVGSAMGFAIYSSREIGNIEIYMEKIPVYKSISPKEVKEFNPQEILENQNVDSDELDPNLESSNETINGKSASDEDNDNDEPKEIENKKIIKEREINKEIDEKDGVIDEKKISKEDDSDDSEIKEDLIENESQVKGVEKEQSSDEDENEVKSEQEEGAEDEEG